MPQYICCKNANLAEQTPEYAQHTPPYEEMCVCPRCEGTNIHQTRRCDVCGEWITGGYAVTVDGNRICDDCYTKHDVEDD